jgi:transcription elongation factor GreA
MSEIEQPVYVTPEGLRKLHEELAYLCKVRRPEVAQNIADAKADGDISENAGYDEAKNAQAFLEGRILTLQSLLRRAVPIAEGSSEYVAIGSQVTIQEVGSGAPETYQIVGSAEASPAQGRISNVSPMGKALMNRTVGDGVSVNTPAGVLRFEILSIECLSKDCR